MPELDLPCPAMCGEQEEDVFSRRVLVGAMLHCRLLQSQASRRHPQFILSHSERSSGEELLVHRTDPLTLHIGCDCGE